MFRKFIESLSKLAKPLEGSRLAAQARMAEPENLGQSREEAVLCASFWRECLAFQDFDSLVKNQGGKAPHWTLPEVVQGRKKGKTAPERQRSDGPRKDVLVALGLSAQGWSRRSKTPRSYYVLGIPAEQDEHGDLFPKPGQIPYFNPRYVRSNSESSDIFITTTERVHQWMERYFDDGAGIENDEACSALDKATSVHLVGPGLVEWMPLWETAQSLLLEACEASKPSTDLSTLKKRIEMRLGIENPQDWIATIFKVESSSSVSHVEALYDAILDPNQAHGQDLSTFERLCLGNEGGAALSGAAALISGCAP